MWKCRACGEEVEDDFGVCWNCQHAKDGTVSQPVPDAPAPANLVETTTADGVIEVTVAGQALACVVCRNTTFHERDTLLNTRIATFFNFDWANKAAINYICTRCGYIHWFWGE